MNRVASSDITTVLGHLKIMKTTDLKKVIKIDAVELFAILVIMKIELSR